MTSPSAVKGSLSWLTLAAVFGLAAGAGLLFSALNRPIFGFTLFATILGAFAGFLSGNLRLFCLWGLVLTLPLELNLNFRVMPPPPPPPLLPKISRPPPPGGGGGGPPQLRD